MIIDTDPKEFNNRPMMNKLLYFIYESLCVRVNSGYMYMKWVGNMGMN